MPDQLVGVDLVLGAAERLDVEGARPSHDGPGSPGVGTPEAVEARTVGGRGRAGHHGQAAYAGRRQAGSGPVQATRPAGHGATAVVEGRAQVGAAEADVGGERIGQRRVLDRRAVGRDGGDAAVHQRADAHPSGAVHGEAVEHLQAGQAGEEVAAVPGRRGDRDLPRGGDGPGVDAAGVGLGRVEHGAVGRQADAVRRVEGEDHLLARRAVGLGVVDAGAVAGALLADAVVGEPEAAVAVEHEVVGRPQRSPGRLRVERGHRARGEVDPLDAPARPLGRHGPWDGEPHEVLPLEAAAVVAHVHGAVGPDGGAVGPAPGSATTSVPSGQRPWSACRAISTSTTLPSSEGDRTSGNFRPLAERDLPWSDSAMHRDRARG